MAAEDAEQRNFHNPKVSAISLFIDVFSIQSATSRPAENRQIRIRAPALAVP
jgi:hypothetical protein